jgi:hypothetical protein
LIYLPQFSKNLQPLYPYFHFDHLQNLRLSKREINLSLDFKFSCIFENCDN